MKTRLVRSALILSAALSIGSAQAQMPSLSQFTGGSGGLAGLAGGLLPNVASAGAGNAAGVLGYCVKHNVLSGAGVTSVLGQLTGQRGVTGSKGYAAGRAGELQTGNGQAFSLDAVKGKVKTKVCDMVLKHAKSFL